MRFWRAGPPYYSSGWPLSPTADTVGTHAGAACGGGKGTRDVLEQMQLPCLSNLMSDVCVTALQGKMAPPKAEWCPLTLHPGHTTATCWAAV